MNQKGFINILIIIGIVITVGIVGYFAMHRQVQPTIIVPVIERISPAEASIGTEISVIGSGFTATSNSLQFGAGFAYINNLTSPDGKTIMFVLPESFDTCNPDGNICAEFLSRPIPGQTYEVTVINTNGRSNSVKFTVTSVPETPMPTPASRPNWKPYAPDGTCPPGYVDYGIPLQCVTPEYMKYCQGHPCPICLAGNTLIDTPFGSVAVRDLQVGMPVWTTDKTGQRIYGVITKTSKVPVSPNHRMIHLILDDGRALFVSPGHPTIDGRAVGELLPGELYDGVLVVSTERVSYGDGATYDILPSGDTGFYWANSILIGSTLR